MTTCSNDSVEKRIVEVLFSQLPQGGGQQDSHELLRCLLGGLQAEEDNLLKLRFDSNTAAVAAELQVSLLPVRRQPNNFDYSIVQTAVRFLGFLLAPTARRRQYLHAFDYLSRMVRAPSKPQSMSKGAAAAHPWAHGHRRYGGLGSWVCHYHQAVIKCQSM